MGAALACAAATYHALFASPDLPPPPPATCAVFGSEPPAAPPRRVLGGAGVFQTRRRYQASLDRLATCVAARADAEPVCGLAERSSAWRAHARDAARDEANLLARRFSHFLDCGARGWVRDCPAKTFDDYVARYAERFAEDCGRRKARKCAPLCAYFCRADLPLTNRGGAGDDADIP